MKTLKTVLFLFLSAGCFGQIRTGFPTEVTNNETFDDILRLEGHQYNEGNVYVGTIPVSGNQAMFKLIGNFGRHKVVFGEGEISSDTYIKANYSSNGDQDGVYPASLVSPGISPGAPFHLNFWKSPMWANSITINASGGDGTTVIKAGGIFTGVMLTNDLNFKAKKKIYWLGDSVTDNTVNSSLTLDQYYHYIVRDWLNAQTGGDETNNYRLVIRGIAGKTSQDFEKLRKSGALYINNPTTIFYQLGINDASQSTGTTNYTTAINNLIVYKNAIWPDAMLIFLGSTPVQDNTLEATIATYRTAMSNAVAAANNPKVKYISLAGAFDRTATFGTIWASTDMAGNGIHPGTALSQAGIAAAIISGLQSMGYTP